MNPSTGSPAKTIVSVVVPTKNRADLLRCALASIRALEGPDLTFEIIVADNGSTDDTAAVVAEAGARLVYESTPGAAAARNASMRAASGEFIAFLDDDDAWLPGNVRAQLNVLRTDTSLAGAVAQVVMTDADLVPVTAPYPESLSHSGNFFVDFLARYPQIGATVVRSSVRDSVGYFDESLIGDQDWDWHLRLARTHSLGFVATPGVLFRSRRVLYDDLQWCRLRPFHRVFLRHALRARVAPWHLLRIYLRLTGGFYGYFRASAERHLLEGDTQGARRSWLRGLVASPIHALHDVARDPGVRSHLTRSFRR